jgi:membrane protease subunit HflC
MNKSLPSLLALIPLALLLGLYMFFFQVRESEVAVVRTFGRIAERADGHRAGVITEPGPYFRWPWPIQKVTILDKRLHMTRTTPEETPTRDGKPIIVTTAVGWRIEDPYRFSTTCTDVADAENKLKSRVRSDQKTVIAAYDFSNLFSTDPADLKYDELEAQIADAVREAALDFYGVKVTYVKIDKLSLPGRITEQVFTAMKSERQAEATRYTADGEAQAKQITSEADGIALTIESFANRVAMVGCK